MGIELTERARVCVESIYLSVETPIIPGSLIDTPAVPKGLTT